MRAQTMALKYFLFAITNDADAVVLVAAPELQELSRQSVWPHSGTRHQHTRHEVLELGNVMRFSQFYKS